MRRFAVVLRMLLLWPVLTPAVGAAQQAAPGREWPVAKPAALGLNAAVLDSIDGEIKAGKYGYVDRMLVIRHGKVAFNARYPHDYKAAYGDSAKVNNALNAHDLTGPFNYFNPWWHPTYRGGDLHTLQSVTKTVASVVIGAAVTRGDFPSLDTPILKFWDTTKVANIDARKRRITVRHLLTMTGGFDWNENLPYIDPNNTASGLEESPDWVAFTINRPMMREPGTQFNYSSGESVLLAHIFRQATGQDIEEYAAKYLFAPIGIERWFWKRTPSGSVDTEGGLYLEATDRQARRRHHPSMGSSGGCMPIHSTPRNSSGPVRDSAVSSRLRIRNRTWWWCSTAGTFCPEKPRSQLERCRSVSRRPSSGSSAYG